MHVACQKKKKHKDIVKYLIDKNKEKLKSLYIKSNKYSSIVKDIINNGMINKNQLNSERLQIIIEMCVPILNTSSSLIKVLMKDNNEYILNIFLNHLKFFDNLFIIDFFHNYKNKIPISDTELYTRINNGKYKISTDIKKYINHEVSLFTFAPFSEFDSSYYYYLFNACESGIKEAVKYLVEHGADINKENKFGWTPIFIACQKGHINIVKYLVEHGADINKETYFGRTLLNYAYDNRHTSIH